MQNLWSLAILKNVKTLLTTVTSGSSGRVEGFAVGSGISAEEDGGREGDTCTN